MLSPTSSSSFSLPDDQPATTGTSATTLRSSEQPFNDAQDCETNVAATITTATEPTDLEVAQQQESLLLYTLARQLEYYFSPQNLATDLYLRTLRDLNNGCVPVTILANFGKVRAILAVSATATATTTSIVHQEEYRMHAILQAVNEYYTDVLQIYSIDAATGKIATDDTPSSANTILAVGPRNSPHGEIAARPGQDTLVSRQSSSSSLTDQCPRSPTTSRANCFTATSTDSTIILRDVDPIVTGEEVHGLLQEIEDCPPVLSIVSDVANSWYVCVCERACVTSLTCIHASELLLTLLPCFQNCVFCAGLFCWTRRIDPK
jgi:La domain